MSAPTVRYRLFLPEPESHLVDVEMHIGGAGDQLVVAMAAWCPGSYLIRDYARFVRDLEATSGDGHPLRVRKLDKQRWRIDAEGADEVVVRYRVYGHELSVRTNHIDESHAFLHGPATYLYLPEHRGAPASLEIHGPPGRGWHVATGLRREGEHYIAADVDELLDGPVHLSALPPRRFRAAGVDVSLALWGLPARSRFGLGDLERDLIAIVEQHAARFGGAPMDEYTFMLMLSPGAYGGLEHATSSANLNTPLALDSDDGYQDLLELLSHEFFHVWNGKRLFPAAFAPFDYGTEQHTRCLWVMEGITSYVDRLAVRTAKRLPVQRYMKKLLGEWVRLQMSPGRFRHSLEEASFDAWIKLYKPDESNLNTTISYYLKGGLVMLALDLELRKRADRTLDDVLRHMWERYGSRGIGYPEDVQADFETAAGCPLGELFADHIRGRAELDLAPYLAHVGLALEGVTEPADGNGGASSWLGVLLRDGTTVAAVIDDSPAHTAGVSPGDDIVAVGGLRVRTDADLRRRVAVRDPGEDIELALFRRDQLVTLQVALGETPPNRWRIRGLDELGATHRELYAGWMGEAHPGAGEVLATSEATPWI